MSEGHRLTPIDSLLPDPDKAELAMARSLRLVRSIIRESQNDNISLTEAAGLVLPRATHSENIFIDGVLIQEESRVNEWRWRTYEWRFTGAR